MHCGFRRDHQLECLVRYRAGGHRRWRDADECVYEDSAIVVVVIEYWHASGVMRVRVTTPMHMDRTTMMMVGRMVVWMRVSQGSAYGGALDGQRQHDSDGLSGHVTLLVRLRTSSRAYGRRSRRVAPMTTEPHQASFLKDPSLVGGRAGRCQPKKGEELPSHLTMQFATTPTAWSGKHTFGR
jgi:hypothetical protein